MPMKHLLRVGAVLAVFVLAGCEEIPSVPATGGDTPADNPSPPRSSEISTLGETLWTKADINYGAYTEYAPLLGSFNHWTSRFVRGPFIVLAEPSIRGREGTPFILHSPDGVLWSAEPTDRGAFTDCLDQPRYYQGAAANAQHILIHDRSLLLRSTGRYPPQWSRMHECGDRLDPDESGPSGTISTNRSGFFAFPAATAGIHTAPTGLFVTTLGVDYRDYGHAHSTNGERWVYVNDDGLDGFSLSQYVVEATDGRSLFIVHPNNVIARTLDGLTWTAQVATGDDDCVILSMAWKGDGFISFANGYVCKSSDGFHWEKVNAHKYDHKLADEINHIASNPDGSVIVAARKGLFISRDGGRTWAEDPYGAATNPVDGRTAVFRAVSWVGDKFVTLGITTVSYPFELFILHWAP